MPDDKDKAVLAARVLSFLKRSAGDGPNPTAAETKAAVAAVTLLKTAFLNEANNSAEMFEKLKAVARKESANAERDGLNAYKESINAQKEADMIHLQMLLEKQKKMYEMLAIIMKQQSEMSKTIISNLKS